MMDGAGKVEMDEWSFTMEGHIGSMDGRSTRSQQA